MPRRTAARVLAWIVALGGILHLLALLPVVHDGLGLLDDPLLSSSQRAVWHVASVLAGVSFVLIAPQLARGKQRAWLVALLLFLAAVVIHVLKGPDPLITLYSAAMCLALVWFRDAFRAPSDPASLSSVVRFVPTYLALVFAFGALSLVIEHERVFPDLTVGGVVETVFLGLFGQDGPYSYEGRFLNDFFPWALLGLGIMGLVVLSVLLFRAVAQRTAPTTPELDRARALVRAYGSDTLAYFALRDDKSYFFASDGRAMVAYTLVSGYALAAADPIGAPASCERVLDEFLDFCRDRAWHVAFLAVREEDTERYRRRGLHGVYLGDEAIIRCDRFTLEGSAMKSVRSAVKRVGKHASFRLMRESSASPQLCSDLNEIRDRWRGKAPERGFTMELGGGVRGENPNFLLAVAFAEGEQPLGFLRLVPCYGDQPGWSLDLMQHDPDAPNGITEFLIANAALALGERDFTRLSMNFAAWGRLFDATARLSPAQRLLKKLAELLNPFFQIKSLRDFNQKFDPEWLPRAIVVEDPAQMPMVGLLYASVEGFLNLPLIGRFLLPKVPAEGVSPGGGSRGPAPAPTPGSARAAPGA